MFLSSPFVPMHQQGRLSKSPYDAQQQANPRTTPVPIQKSRPKPSRRQAPLRGSRGDKVPPSSGFINPSPDSSRMKQPPASESMEERTPAERVQGMAEFPKNIVISQILDIVVQHTTQQRLAPRIANTLMKLEEDELRRFLASPEELKAEEIRAKEHILLLLEAQDAGPPSRPLSDLNGIGEALPNVEK